MPVVINEFEVVDSAPADARGQGNLSEEPGAGPLLPHPEDLRRLLAQMAEQALRRFGH